MNIIVAVDKNWGIGNKGDLLVKVPEDMKNFRRLTLGKAVVMGRKTFESLPNQKPLKNRVNIVLSKSIKNIDEDVKLYNSIESFLENIQKYRNEDIFIIGGSSIYKQFMPYCDTLYLTKFMESYESDSFFPNIDEMGGWKIESESDTKTHEDISFKFYKYKKISKVK